MELHWEPDESPSPGQWEALGGVLRKYPARWMVWEGEPNPTTAEQLREQGLGSVIFDPCGNAPSEGDYLSVMRQNILNIQNVLRD